MKTTLFFAAMVSLGLTTAYAQESAAMGGSSSLVARQTYEDKSSQDLRELRRGVDAVYEQTPLAGQAALAPYLNAVAAAEQAFADYKIASDVDRPARQKDLEAAKANAVRLWSDFRATHGTGAASSAANNSVENKTL